ncbi:DUF202 domain-containing protein [Rhodobacteraceae bacterium D3-12]|nr:DUF202 domain-containing protein [Rhodobacteraceae bacterium D3-12]
MSASTLSHMADTSQMDSDEKSEVRTEWSEDRTIMANERTFASWAGAGMGAIGVAIGLQAVFGETDPTWLAKTVATLFLLVAIAVFWSARTKACATYTRLTEHDAEARSTRDFNTITIMLILGAIGVGVILWLI